MTAVLLVFLARSQPSPHSLSQCHLADCSTAEGGHYLLIFATLLGALLMSVSRKHVCKKSTAHNLLQVPRMQQSRLDH